MKWLKRFIENRIDPSYDVESELSDRPVVFCCVQCGREQAKRETLDGVGVSVAEAKMLGWQSTPRGWMCPFCSGRKSK
jgi:rubredoxin